MVENSVGRLWLESHPDSKLRDHMPYYLESEGGQTAKPDKPLTPQDLTVMDPACGSGHILVYAFDLLFHIYTEAGYSERDIPALILEHNLYGLEIDERTAQLASFALLMKARAKSRRVLRDPPPLNVTHTVPTRGWTLPNTPDLNKADWQLLLDAFKDADNLGSLITPPELDYSRLEAQLVAFERSGRQEVSHDAPKLRQLLMQAQLLARRYRAVVANPPYMGGKAFNKAVKDFVTAKYPRSKSDLFAVFMELALDLTEPQGIMSMINQHSWMFLGAYENLRSHLLEKFSLLTMLHLGPRTFPEIGGEVVQSTAFNIRNGSPTLSSMTFVKLTDLDSTKEKERAFLSGKHRYHFNNQKDFAGVPGSPIAYWVNKRLLSIFERYPALQSIADVKSGISTGNNDRFLRYWFEVPYEAFTPPHSSNQRTRWIPHQKGGARRRWYGNNEYVIDWEKNGKPVSEFEGAYLRNVKYYFLGGITWTVMGGDFPSFRHFDDGYIIGHKGPGIYPHAKDTEPSILLFLNSKVTSNLLSLVSQSLGIEIGHLSNLPVNTAKAPILEDAVLISKTDWDNFETSWDFQTHPLLRHDTTRLSTAFDCWHRASDDAFYELKRLEEENNRYWIDAYGLQDELSPDVPEDQITIRRADKERDIKSLLSYAVGCMMGRYSLDKPGLQFAGGDFDMGAFGGDFAPDKDSILPITDEAYFEDDIVSRFVDFLRAAFGPEALQENLDFVADALSRKSGESATERIRRYFVSEFVLDHARTYSKRPIYWLFTSGKENAFGGLVYLHRYTPDTLAQMRNDYVLPLQSKLEAEISGAGGAGDSDGVLGVGTEGRGEEAGEAQKPSGRVAGVSRPLAALR